MDQINPLDMSSEDFANFDFDSFMGESEASPEAVEAGPEEEFTEEFVEDAEGGNPSEFIDDAPDEPEYSEEETSDELEVEDASEVEAAQPESLYTVNMDGVDISLNSDEEVKQYIEASSRYYKDAQEYSKSRDMIQALRDNNISESQLAFAIDLLKKDPKAINALVKDVDLVEVLDDESEYVAPSIAKPKEQQRIEQVLQSISNTPTYNRTVDVIGKQWDGASLQQFRDNPDWIITLNQHMESGVFDAVNTEVKKRRMMGLIPNHLSDYQVYDMVGESMYAPKQQAPANPIRKPQREEVVKRKQSMSTPRGSSKSVREREVDPLSMSTEEFEAYKRKHPKLFQ